MSATALVTFSSVLFRCPSEASLYHSSSTKFQFLKISKEPKRQLFRCFRHLKCSSTGANNRHGFSYVDNFNNEPFWLAMVKDVAWGMRSLVVFLLEQPSQLKFVEWPTFHSTLMTAALTLVLVALLIVALSSIDSCLCYVLASLLRKSL